MSGSGYERVLESCWLGMRARGMGGGLVFSCDKNDTATSPADLSSLTSRSYTTTSTTSPRALPGLTSLPSMSGALGSGERTTSSWMTESPEMAMANSERSAPVLEKEGR